MTDLWIKRGISVFLVFHLIAVFITPNPNSYLSQSLASIYRPYVNFLGLSATWGFFAPEPISPPMYIDYVIENKKGPPENGRFPDEISPYFLRDRHNRRMSLSKFLLSSDDNIRNMFVRHLCLTHPDMTLAKIWRVLATQPSLEMVRSGEKKMTDPVDFKIEVFGTFYCPEEK